MRVTRCLLVGLMMVAIAGSAWAQKAAGATIKSEDIKKLPGFVEFDASQIFGGAEPKVNLLLEEALLKVMVGAVKEDQPELADLLQDINLIQVQVFKGRSEQEKKYFDKVSELIKGLKETRGWNTVISVNENGKTVDVLIKTGVIVQTDAKTLQPGEKFHKTKEAIVGLALFVAERSEFVFINIAGEFDPELLGGKLQTLVGKFFSAGGLDLSELGRMFENLQNAGQESESPTPSTPESKSQEQ